jgi:hypothetical protein
MRFKPHSAVTSVSRQPAKTPAYGCLGAPPSLLISRTLQCALCATPPTGVGKTGTTPIFQPPRCITTDLKHAPIEKMAVRNTHHHLVSSDFLHQATGTTQGNVRPHGPLGKASRTDPSDSHKGLTSSDTLQTRMESPTASLHAVVDMQYSINGFVLESVPNFETC